MADSTTGDWELGTYPLLSRTVRKNQPAKAIVTKLKKSVESARIPTQTIVIQDCRIILIVDSMKFPTL
jgi:hypothetical protein